VSPFPNPIHAWRLSGQLNPNDPAYTRPTDPLTNYQGVEAGNVAVGSPSITDVGQIGQGNIVGLHGPDPAMQYVTPDPRRTVPLSNVEAIPPSVRVIYRRLAGGIWNPGLLKDAKEETVLETGVWASATGEGNATGSPKFATEIYEHGPVTDDELEELSQVRQPQNKPMRSLWRRLLMLPQQQTDHTGAFDERVMPQVGRILPDDTADRVSPAAAGYGNRFTLPDIRRTFDQPLDAPSDVLDEFGHPVVDKAGYPLTHTVLEGSIHELQTSHTYPVTNDIGYTDIGAQATGSRAGPAHSWEGRAAHMPHWFWFRPYDKLMADHPFGTKGMLRQPQISRPIFTTQEVETEGGAGGNRRFAPAAGMEVAGLIPNSDRQVPEPWDTQLYTAEQGAGISGVSARSGASWRVG
jgi:hypothetical protein